MTEPDWGSPDLSDIPYRGGAVKVVELLSDILELLAGSDESDAPCPLPPFCRVGVYPGFEVPWDSCSTDACSDADGQLWGAIQGITRVAGNGVGSCQSYQFTAQVGAVRCAAKMTDDDRNPFPPIEAIQQDAVRQAIDADGIRYAIECCPQRPQRLKDAGIVLDSWTPLGPNECVGGAWTIRGRIDVCC